MKNLSRVLSVAPMMDRTDRHCRYFLRLFSPNALLYTEMITAAAILRGDRQRLLAFHPAEHPVALQLGGSEPGEMAEAAVYGADAGYDEINLNIGCPSDRVQSGTFGACLMREPRRVADCVAAIRARVGVPVTVKTRIGIEDGEGGAARALQYEESDYERLYEFVATVAAAGCSKFVIHARKAVLKGFSPKDNREIPPLRYEIVRRLKQDFPALEIIANGGIRDTEQALGLLKSVDGVMIGREAYHNPYFLAALEQALHSKTALSAHGNDKREGAALPQGREPQISWQPPERLEVFEQLASYAAEQVRAGHRLHSITRHVAGLFAGQSGARQWRRFFSEQAARNGAGVEVLNRACELMRNQKAA